MLFKMQRINWGQALGESFLIVLGILVALGIDSYVGERAERAEVDAYLSDLVLELRADSASFEERRLRLGELIVSASRVLEALQSGEVDDIDMGSELLGSLFGEAITSEPVVWEELRTTGNLRLISDPTVRTAVVSHYLDRSSRLSMIDENFTPAVRGLRALAWDILPLGSFFSFFRSGKTGVPDGLVIRGLRRRDDAEFLLKRMVVTASVARRNLGLVVDSTGTLIRLLSER